MARVDLTVRGGGILGLSCAWEAARRGVRVRLIETVAIGAGASGGIVGALAPHVPDEWNAKKQFQLESLLMLDDWWAEVERASGLSAGYARTGRLQPLADEAAVALARKRAESAVPLWQGRAEWRVIAASGAPWEPATSSGYLVHDTLTARLHPRRALEALLAAFRAMGGEVVIGEAADEGPVIWATGIAGLDDLSAVLGKSAGSGIKGQALTLRHPAADLPQLQLDGLHIIPHADGTVAIGSTSERFFDHAAGVDSRLDDLLARAQAALPVLAGAEVVERWAAVRPRATSRAPLLGPWPGRPGQYLANGGFKIGFGIAPKVAQVMADLVLDGQDAIPPGFRLG